MYGQIEDNPTFILISGKKLAYEKAFVWFHTIYNPIDYWSNPRGPSGGEVGVGARRLLRSLVRGFI